MLRETIEKLLYGYYNDMELYFNEDNVTASKNCEEDLTFIVKLNNPYNKSLLDEISEILELNTIVNGWINLPIGAMITINLY